MRILVTGSTGLTGRALAGTLRAGGHSVLRLVRRRTALAEDEAAWVPAEGQLDPAPLEGLDAAIHLAGENIAAGRWTPARKAAIRDSRIQGTQLLADTLARLAAPPKVFVCASAVGYYGNRGDTPLDENEPPGKGFLAEVCREWETAAARAACAGTRVVSLRMGMVLAAEGGALAKMLPVFKLGIAGRLGSGRQYISWIPMDDLVRLICFCLETDSLEGPVNAVSPEPVTNETFTQTLARVLHKPACLPVPSFALRLALGEMADELLLGGARVLPKRLEDAGFSCAHPRIEEALRGILGRPRV